MSNLESVERLAKNAIALSLLRKPGDSDSYTKEESDARYPQFANLSNYLTQADGETYQPKSLMVNYALNSSLISYFTKTESDLRYLRLTDTGNFVTSTYLDLNYFNKTVTNSTFARLADLVPLVTNTSLNTTLSQYLPINSTQYVRPDTISALDARVTQNRIDINFLLSNSASTPLVPLQPASTFTIPAFRITPNMFSGCKIFTTQGLRLGLSMYPNASITTEELRPNSILPPRTVAKFADRHGYSIVQKNIYYQKTYLAGTMGETFFGFEAEQIQDSASQDPTFAESFNGLTSSFFSTSTIGRFDANVLYLRLLPGDQGYYAPLAPQFFSSPFRDTRSQPFSLTCSDTNGAYDIYFGPLVTKYESSPPLVDFGLFFSAVTPNPQSYVPSRLLDGYFVSLLTFDVRNLDKLKDWLLYLKTGVASVLIPGTEQVHTSMIDRESMVAYALEFIKNPSLSPIDYVDGISLSKVMHLNDLDSLEFSEYNYATPIENSKFTSMLFELNCPQSLVDPYNFLVIIDSAWDSNFLSEMQNINASSLQPAPLSYEVQPIVEKSTLFNGHTMSFSIEVPTGSLESGFIVTVCPVYSKFDQNRQYTYKLTQLTLDVSKPIVSSVNYSELLRRNAVSNQIANTATNVATLDDLAHYLYTQIQLINSTVSDLSQTVSAISSFLNKQNAPKPTWLTITDVALSGFQMLLSAFFPELSFVPALLEEVINDIYVQDISSGSAIDIIFDVIGLVIAAGSKYKTEIGVLKDKIRTPIDIGNEASAEELMEMQVFYTNEPRFDAQTGTFVNIDSTMLDITINNETVLDTDIIYTNYSALPFPPADQLVVATASSCLWTRSQRSDLISVPIPNNRFFGSPTLFTDGTVMDFDGDGNTLRITSGARRWLVPHTANEVYIKVINSYQSAVYTRTNRFGPFGIPMTSGYTFETNDQSLHFSGHLLTLDENTGFGRFIWQDTHSIGINITIHRGDGFVNVLLERLGVRYQKTLTFRMANSQSFHCSVYMRGDRFHFHPHVKNRQAHIIHLENVVTMPGMHEIIGLHSRGFASATFNPTVVSQQFQPDRDILFYEYNDPDRPLTSIPYEPGDMYLLDAVYTVYNHSNDDVVTLEKNYKKYNANVHTPNFPQYVVDDPDRFVDFVATVMHSRRPISMLSEIVLCSNRSWYQ